MFSFLRRVLTAFNPPASQLLPDTKPIKFGILGAAAIAPSALIYPVKSHSEAIVYAVAARDKSRAVAFAKKHNIEKVYSGPTGYQELLDDPEIDAIYNPLPNGLHYEWTMKALAAGKHVLLEKPSADIAKETREMFELAKKKELVLLEAFHYRFHPAIQRVKAIIDSGELGAIKHIATSLTIPKGIMAHDDIRYNHSLGGGALMDMGCYTMNCIRYLSSSNPVSILDATHDLHKARLASNPPNVDRGTTATLALPNNVTATLKCDLGVPFTLGIIPSMPQVRAIVTCEKGEIELYNFVAPTIYHFIRVDSLGGDGKSKNARIEKVYTFADGKMEGKGEPWWTTYRFQLEAFVDRVKGRTPQTWLDKEDSVANMHWIEEIYAKTGLGSRPHSEYIHT